MLSELHKKIENEKAGVIDRFGENRKRPLSEHVSDWENSLKAGGSDPENIKLKMARVRSIVDGCRFLKMADMNADRQETFLQDLRIKVKRSIQTVNHWLQAIRQFCRWLVVNDRFERDPFHRLKPGNVKLDQRRRRGEFTPEEVARLLTATGSSQAAFRGLGGLDHRLLYRVALGTGFRAKELASLTPLNFDFSTAPATVTLSSQSSKNKKGAIQPLGDELADELKRELGSRAEKEPLWPGTWSDRAADMLKADLDAADIPVKVDGPDGEEVRDFHAFRSCFISNVLRSGADLKQAMTLARHSDPRLTTTRYARTRLYDLGAVLNKLPSVIETVPLRMTGPDGGSVSGAATGAAASGNRQLRMMTNGEALTVKQREAEMQNSLTLQGVESNQGASRTIETERAGFPEATVMTTAPVCDSTLLFSVL